MFGEEATLQFTRAIGSSMARVADAALSLFLVNVEGPLREKGTPGTPLAEASEDAVASLDVIPSLMAGFFRLHMQAAINRQRIANRSTASPGVFRLAVGFVDLVGFTPYTEDVGHDELAGFVESFEARANDVVAERGGRVVKHIGDEVMFVDADATNACEIALRLVETFGDQAGVSPHAGVGYGPLVARGGDYYGSVVNLASRIADLAVPGEVLVTETVEQAAVAAGTDFVFDPAGRRMLKGFAEPIPLWSVTRERPAP
jgi:adenylate cyclase